jgi:N-acetylglucosaminyldiphosphoundecaprenol N-acetyl-beta-D-mannosaminyltransferase
MNASVSSPVRSAVILGVPFHDLTLDETVGRIGDLIRERTPRYLATANLDFALQASRDVELQRILLEAEYVLCDGMPLVWASRRLGAPLRERVSGSDLVPRVAAEAERRGWRVFILGGSPDSLDGALANLRAAHPRLAVDGFSPPVASLLELDHAAITERIRTARPDILLVAFGCPKQEKWIYMHHRQLGVPVSIGVGATVDFLAGKFRRAPRWVQRAGAEWIFRLLQEPRRLGNRYLLDLAFYVQALRRERRLFRQRARRTSGPDRPSRAPAESVAVHRWSGEIDAAGIQAGRVAPVPELLPGEALALDLSGVTFMDSAGIGLLVALYRGRVRSGAGLVLVNPSPAVRALLAALKLDRLLPIAREASEVAALLGFRRVGPAAKPDEHTVNVAFVGELTAARVSSHRSWLEDAWAAKPAARRLRLDCSQIGFIDSSGLGLLLHAARLARQRDGAELRIRGAGPNLRNVTQLARVDALFHFEDAHA